MEADVLLIPNFGAEEGAGWGEPAYRPPGEAASDPQPSREILPRVASRLWQSLFARGARCLGESERAEDAFWPKGLGVRSPHAIFSQLDVHDRAVAWLNTPAARGFARDWELRLFGADPEIVREVHDKAFAHRVSLEERIVPACLAPCIAVFEPDELRDPDAAIREIEERLAQWPDWTRGRFTLKPRFGTSGRGRVAGNAGRVAAASGGFARLADAGGAMLEPWLKRTCDLSAQLWIGADREIVLLGTTELLVEGSGLYRGHRGFVDSRGRVNSGNAYDEPLREAAVAVARAAAAAGYCGPCGVDAFAFEREPGRVELRAVVEFNARFTLGIIAIGLLRRALAEIRRELSLDPGGLRPFLFRLDAPPGGWPESGDAQETLMIPLSAEDPGAAAHVEPGLLLAHSREALDGALAIQRAAEAPASERLH
ncbi:MAG: hypothetical protein JRE43_06715 [Deltaproteobacteria bacterium]|jgi:hypothetical protein|nr:hypothetical protein [Deltaproteobacteria bacterium]MBW2543283.1 hypothetical protein [Deltaproteobacteria bacterium]